MDDNMRIRNANLIIPVEMISFSFLNKMLKELTVYLYLKMYTDGKELFDKLKKDLKLKDKRTLDKYIRNLIRCNWMGYDVKTGNYFIRSFNHIRVINHFKKRNGVTFQYKNFKTCKSFFAAAVIGSKVNGIKYKRTLSKGKTLGVTNKGDVAFQPDFSFTGSGNSRDGLANQLIAKELGCSKTMASNLKNMAARDGYLKVKPQYIEFVDIKDTEGGTINHLNTYYPNLSGRFKIKKTKKGNKIVVQVYDEITPCIKFKTITKLTNAASKCGINLKVAA